MNPVDEAMWRALMWWVLLFAAAGGGLVLFASAIFEVKEVIRLLRSIDASLQQLPAVRQARIEQAARRRAS